MFITDRIYKNIFSVPWSAQQLIISCKEPRWRKKTIIIVLLISLWLCSDLLSISPETHSKP